MSAINEPNKELLLKYQLFNKEIILPSFLELVISFFNVDSKIYLYTLVNVSHRRLNFLSFGVLHLSLTAVRLSGTHGTDVSIGA